MMSIVWCGKERGEYVLLDIFRRVYVLDQILEAIQDTSERSIGPKIKVCIYLDLQLDITLE
jgi:hypothetical protein